MGFSPNVLDFIRRILIMRLLTTPRILLKSWMNQESERNLHFQQGVAYLQGQFQEKIEWGVLPYCL